ncbi:MAG: putative metal transport system ATP-binding protein [Candidatus Hydrogenedentota bacterium]
MSPTSQPHAVPIEVHDLTVAYHHRPVLWDIDVVFPEGQLIAVVGPNGAGKSTLIKAIMGLVPLASGTVSIFGQNVRDGRRLIAYVPQRESVDWDFPTTAFDVVLMGRYGHLPLFGRPRKRDKEIARQSLEKVGMLDYAKRQISQLSGGQQQRVFLARALAQQTRVYLMDEPFAGVDAATEKAIVELLRELREQGSTVIVVHHDLQSVPEYFDSVLLLNLRMVAFGKVESTFTTENLHKTYGGRLNLLTEVGEKLRKQEWSARE